MAVVVALSATLNLWNLRESGYGNLYYTAAVRSMSQSWHNFFFAAYDPGGFITVDKPPLGFWAQVLSVKLLGFSAFSVLLPEALAGTLSVVVLWRLTRRSFGPLAGVLAALALAVSPINVVANRDNILEPLLTLTLLLAAWAVLVAAQRGSLRLLLLGAALVGLGFNIKMLEAYLVVPALVAVYLVGSRTNRHTRLRHLTLAGAVLLMISFAWIGAVDMVPASQRPYVGSTVTDSELELAISYNGAGRLLGGLRPDVLIRQEMSHVFSHGALHASPSLNQQHGTPETAAHHHIGEQAPLSASGAPGALRLFQAPLGSQVGWLLPLAAVALALLLVETVSRLFVGAAPRGFTRARWLAWRADPRTLGLLLWGGWLLTDFVCFSFARSINAYYVAVFAPAICALAGVFAAEFWRTYCSPVAATRRGIALGLLFPLALAGSLIQQTVFLSFTPTWWPSLAPLLVEAAGALACLLYLLRGWGMLVLRRAHGVAWRGGSVFNAVATALVAVALATTLIAPLGWTLSSMTWGNEGGWPSAGPGFAKAAPRHTLSVDTRTMRYLIAHRGEDRYLVGALNSYITAPLIVATGQPVLDMGGFTGNDPVLTQTMLAQLVAADQVHLFLLPSSNVTPSQRAALFGQPSPAALSARGAARLGGASGVDVAYTNSLTRWVSTHCQPVPPAQWSSPAEANHRLGAWELFACKS